MSRKKACETCKTTGPTYCGDCDALSFSLTQSEAHLVEMACAFIVDCDQATLFGTPSELKKLTRIQNKLIAMQGAPRT